MNKKFDIKLYKKYDNIAKKYAKKELLKCGIKTRVNDNKIGVDLIAFNDNKDLFFIEVEIKKYIKPNEKFKFDTLNIPYRKLKYCN